ncbi:MAG TPA: ATP-binding protein [Pseudomonadales bacterium]|nr:ATP-binding protein [Pseudomonadales bacterium]
MLSWFNFQQMLNFEQKVLLLSALYFGLLFVVAWIGERRGGQKWLSENPVVQVLSLGVLASAWTFYGMVDLFNQYGYGALSYYMGAGGLFVFAPLILMPMFRLSRTYQLHSLADLLVFRFRSPFVGVLATLFMVLCALPLLALQIQAVADTSLIISYRPMANRSELFVLHDQIAVIFCSAIVLFAAVFGAGRERHRGLVTVLALESVVKMVALLMVGLFALRDVFGGFRGLEKWLSLHPEQSEALYHPVENTSSHMLVMLFFATAIVLPHMFHMGFAENTRLRTLRQASWGIPLYLLCLSLPILPILWAGFEVGAAVTPEYFTLGVPLALGKTKLLALAYIGGLSAAIGTTVVMSVALSTMCLNHWILPLYRPIAGMTDLYGLITWLRRVLIALIVAAGYLFYRLLQNGQTLTDLAILSFIGSLQFLPGMFAVLYGPRANRQGLLVGLCAGMSIWLAGLLLPTLAGWRVVQLPIVDVTIRLGIENWSQLTTAAIIINILLFMAVSRLTSTSADELRAAEQCSIDDTDRPLRMELDVHSVADIGERLVQVLGAETARQELQRALADINQTQDDARPYALRRLRDRLEANLSGLMGAAVAHALMDRVVPYHTAVDAPLKEDLHFVENRINQYRHHLTGMAGELDKLRRHHRQTLESLPMAVCSLGDDGEVLLWNRAMVELTGIATETVLGSTAVTLPEPWGHLIDDFLQDGFLQDSQTHMRKQTVEIDGSKHWLSLHKATLGGGDLVDSEGHIIMIDDMTETEQLEQELLHSERLASIGRLAAGVAHEVGNPVTGIACLAQDLKFESDQPEVREAAAQILGQTERITRIVQSLVHFAHAGKAGDDEPVVVDLFECIEEAIHLLSLQKDRTRVHYNNLMAPDALVMGSEQTLTQLFINLLSNARDASQAESPIDISSEQLAGNIVVHIRDYGHGVEPQHLVRLFEPFFTTKQAGQGTGLGLSLVYSIVEDHGGHIDVKSPAEDGIGTEFILTFPAITALDTPPMSNLSE